MSQYDHGLVVPDPVQETAGAFYFTHWFVDLETNVATPRQWREGKRSVVDGKMDEERKMAIRFNRGQSKNLRNAILDAMPEWLVNKAIAEAKSGVRTKIERYIKDKGMAAMQKYVVDQLARFGVTVEQILAKTMRDKVEGLDVDDIVALSGDLKSIESSSENAATLFPAGRAEPQKMDLKDKLKAQADLMPKRDPGMANSMAVGAQPPKAEAEPKAGKHMAVRVGEEAFTFMVNDGMQEYTVKDDGIALKCNCGVTKGPCPHTKAVEAHQKG
jgi:hypothetical protein